MSVLADNKALVRRMVEGINAGEEEAAVDELSTPEERSAAGGGCC